MIVEQILKIIAGPLVDDEHRLAPALLLFLAVGQLAFVYFDMVFVRQPSQGLHIGHLLVLHNEPYRVPALAATKAVACAACRRNEERRRLLVVERTEALVVGARLFQRDKFGNHVDNVGGFLYFFDGQMVYHTCKDSVFFVRFS